MYTSYYKLKLFVVVEAVTGLAAQSVLLDHLLVDIVHIGLDAGLLVTGLHHGEGQVDAGQVIHAEHAHLVVEALLQSDVNFLGGAVAVLDQILGALGQTGDQVVASPSAAKALKFIPMFLTKFIKYKNALGNGVCGDPKVVEAYNSDPLVLKEGTMRLMKNAFIKGCALVNDNIENIKVPTLVMHGEKDGIVVVNTGKWTYENLKVEDKTLKIYSDLYHEIFNEVSKDEVILDMINWLNKKLEDN